jgi:hypothetical protein
MHAKAKQSGNRQSAASTELSAVRQSNIAEIPLYVFGILSKYLFARWAISSCAAETPKLRSSLKSDIHFFSAYYHAIKSLRCQMACRLHLAISPIIGLGIGVGKELKSGQEPSRIFVLPNRAKSSLDTIDERSM